jgi:molybdopterin molybdotransferase
VPALLTIEEALSLVLTHARPLPSEPVPVSAAAGRILAEPAHAAAALPPFPSSAMDGFAIRAADAPGVLPVVLRIAAGRPATRALQPGEAMGIATGAPVPDGADTVVPLERVVDHGNSVAVPADVRAGENVRPRGSDVAEGEEIVPSGRRIGSVQIGALAAAGVAEVTCAARPRVVILSTGTELRRAGEPLGAGQIYESNGPMLAAALAGAGACVERLDPVPDDRQAHRAALEASLGADVLVTSGGVSVGPHDLVRALERELGVEEVFWGVAMRPGKPLAFGVRGSSLVFGLPGNPVSALVGCELFVRPAVLALQGASSPGPHFAAGVLARAVRRSPARDDLLRARREDGEQGVVLTPVVGQESHMIVRAASADSLVHVPRGDGELPAGSPVRYVRLD